MATVERIISKPEAWADVFLIVWSAIGNNDNGAPLALLKASDKSVQVAGTFAGATVTIQGSNDGSNWSTLSDPQGLSLSFTSPGLKTVLEHTRYIRPVSSGGAGTNLTISMFTKGQAE
jgi:hypothetical protein